MIPAPTHDSWRARLHRRRHPGMGWCGRCGEPWPRIEDNHSTPYGYTDDSDVFSASRACFPLCERCWAGMTIPERVPYYERLVGCWTLDQLDLGIYDPESMNRDLETILAAVRAGL